MSYNKAKEERKWRIWKEAEERKMRELGVEESVIQELHTMDWEFFKEDRRFRERQTPNTDLVEIQADDRDILDNLPVRNIRELLQSIQNEQLLQALLTVDKDTLQIAFFKMLGFTTEEISRQMGITPNAIYLRINRLKEKIKNFSGEKENGIS